MWEEKEKNYYFNNRLNDGYIPGYTGHCPNLMFEVGKGYGSNTRQILKEIGSRRLYKPSPPYRKDDHNYLDSLPVVDKPLNDNYNIIKNRSRRYITGYTGFVPGLRNRYGKSYGVAADDSMTNFCEEQRKLRLKAEIDYKYSRSKSAPKMETVHSRDEVRNTVRNFKEINKYKENTITPEFPPITGYTGHIPRVKVTDASLSQRYHCAATKGLEIIRLEREERNRLRDADSKIRSALSNTRCSYYDWG